MSSISPRLNAVQTIGAVAFAPILAGLLLGSLPVVLVVATWRGYRGTIRCAG